MTVIFISSRNDSSITAPKMMLASSSADSRIIELASLTSYRVRSGPPVMLMSTPFAPCMVASSRRGDHTGREGRAHQHHGRPGLDPVRGQRGKLDYTRVGGRRRQHHLRRGD